MKVKNNFIVLKKKTEVAEGYVEPTQDSFYQKIFELTFKEFLKKRLFWNFKFFINSIYYLTLSKKHSFSVVAIYENNKIIHHSCIYPKIPRFKFMGDDDIQVGNIWTHKDYRKKGLATLALFTICQQYNGKEAWYLTKNDNFASIALAKKLGFVEMGTATRPSFFFKSYQFSCAQKIQKFSIYFFLYNSIL